MKPSLISDWVFLLMGVRQRWRVGLVCKTSGLCLSEFDSHHSHKKIKIKFGRLEKFLYLCKRNKKCTVSEAANTSPFHGEDHRFEPDTVYNLGVSHSGNCSRL